MSTWAAFRKNWIKPEVYPLIGSMVAAFGVCSFALASKISQPGMTFNKAARKGGIEMQLEGIDEVKPMWSGMKEYSSSIFEKSHDILENKRQPAAPVTVKVLADAADIAEEEEDTAEVSIIKEAAEVPAAVDTTVESVGASSAAVNASVSSEVEEKSSGMDEALEAKAKEVLAGLKSLESEPAKAAAA